jgi:hypothetical protein
MEPPDGYLRGKYAVCIKWDGEKIRSSTNTSQRWLIGGGVLCRSVLARGSQIASTIILYICVTELGLAQPPEEVQLASEEQVALARTLVFEALSLPRGP